MDRQMLIDHIFAKGRNARAVLQGLETEHLERIEQWYASGERSDFPASIAGEGRPFNVYLIQWEDGAGYVGMTSQSIMDRMERHFENIHLGEGSYEFVWRYEAGIAYRFHCLHTNLDARQAKGLEVQEIQARENLLNLVHNKRLL